MRCPAVQFYTDCCHTGTNRPQYPQGARYDVKKDTKKLLPALLEKAKKQQPLTLLEKEFLADNSTEVDSQEKK